MMNKEELEVRQLLDEAFSNLSCERRDEMFLQLTNQEGERNRFFCVFNGENLARIGAEYKTDTNSTTRISFSTKYDDLENWLYGDD